MINWPPIEAISTQITQTLYKQGWTEIHRRKGQRILTIDLYATIPTSAQQADLKIILGDTSASLLGYKANDPKHAELSWNYQKGYKYADPQFPNNLIQDTGKPHTNQEATAATDLIIKAAGIPPEQ